MAAMTISNALTCVQDSSAQLTRMNHQAIPTALPLSSHVTTGVNAPITSTIPVSSIPYDSNPASNNQELTANIASVAPMNLVPNSAEVVSTVTTSNDDLVVDATTGSGEQAPVSGVTFDSAAANRRRSSAAVSVSTPLPAAQVASNLCDFARVSQPVEPEVEVLQADDGTTTTIVKRYDPQTGTTTKTTTTRRPSTTSGLNALRAIEKNLGFGKSKRVSGDESIPDESRRRVSLHQAPPTSLSAANQTKDDEDDVFKKPVVPASGTGISSYGGTSSRIYGGGSMEFGSSYKSLESQARRRSTSSSGSIGSKDLGMSMYQRRASRPDVVADAEKASRVGVVNGGVVNGGVVNTDSTASGEGRRRTLYNNRQLSAKSISPATSNGVLLRQDAVNRRNSTGVNSGLTKRKDSNCGLDAFRAYEKQLNKDDSNNNNNKTDETAKQLEDTLDKR